MENIKNNEYVFTVRFVTINGEPYERKEKELLVSEQQKNEFIELSRKFAATGKVFATDMHDGSYEVTPGEATSVAELKTHSSAWDIMFHKYLAYFNDFKRENAEYKRRHDRRNADNSKIVDGSKFFVVGNNACMG